MTISTFENYLPDEILIICRYLSCSDVIIAFFNLNTRLNQIIIDYLRHVSLGGGHYHLSQYRRTCSLIQQTSLPLYTRSLTISNRGSPLLAKYFLPYFSLYMTRIEKITMIKFTADEILAYLDAMTKGSQQDFENLVTFHIRDPHYLYCRRGFTYTDNQQQIDNESTIVNRLLTANHQRVESLLINGDEIYM